jgi:uncharacterized membrane protein (UPF0127 family)
MPQKIDEIELYFESQPEYKFKVMLATNDQERTTGLMFRTAENLSEHQGMLFVFKDFAPRTFWMRNTYLQLDIIYLDADKKIVSIVENAQPLSDKALPSIYPAKYVVEIRGNLSKQLNLKTGYSAIFELPKNIVIE